MVFEMLSLEWGEAAASVSDIPNLTATYQQLYWDRRVMDV
jgi:hypothetical protein